MCSRDCDLTVGKRCLDLPGMWFLFEVDGFFVQFRMVLTVSRCDNEFDSWHTNLLPRIPGIVPA